MMRTGTGSGTGTGFVCFAGPLIALGVFGCVRGPAKKHAGSALLLDPPAFKSLSLKLTSNKAEAGTDRCSRGEPRGFGGRSPPSERALRADQHSLQAERVEQRRGAVGVVEEIDVAHAGRTGDVDLGQASADDVEAGEEDAVIGQRRHHRSDDRPVGSC